MILYYNKTIHAPSVYPEDFNMTTLFYIHKMLNMLLININIGINCQIVNKTDTRQYMYMKNGYQIINTVTMFFNIESYIY